MEHLGIPVADMPLFPAATGAEVTMAAMVQTINAAVGLLGQPIRDSTGCWLYGGHSMRTGGAHLLASRGINPFKIQALGRWKSPLVVHYAGDAMATGIANDMARPGPSGAGASGSTLAEFAARIERRLTALEESERSIVARPEPVASDGYYITNVDTGSLHWTRAAPGWAAHLQRANCGWHYFTLRFERSNMVPPQVHFKSTYLY